MSEYKVTKHKKRTKPMMVSLVKSMIERSQLSVKEIAVCTNNTYNKTKCMARADVNIDKSNYAADKHDGRLSSVLLSRPVGEWGNGYESYKKLS